MTEIIDHFIANTRLSQQLKTSSLQEVIHERLESLELSSDQYLSLLKNDPQEYAFIVGALLDRLHAWESVKEEGSFWFRQRHLDQALKGGSLCIWEWDVEAQIILCNSEWFKNHDTTNDLVSYNYQDWLDWIHPEDLAPLKQAHEDILAQKIDTYECVYRLKCKDGNSIWVKDNGEVYQRDEQGNPTLLMGRKLDVSDFQEAQKKISILNQELKQKVQERTAELQATNQELENFAYSISHDLRTPIRHINGYSNLIAKRQSLLQDEVLGEYVKRIGEATLELNNSIEYLLEYSRIGRRNIYIQPIKTEALVRKIVNIQTIEHGSQEAEINVEALPDIVGDPIMIEHMFTNLISNAIKYTSKEAQPKITIRADEKPDGNCFEIIDNGVGFDMNYQHKLFGVFQRLHSSKEFEGNGIGLANVYRIVQRHQGKVWGESELGKGSSFFVFLPKDLDELVNQQIRN